MTSIELIAIGKLLAMAIVCHWALYQAIHFSDHEKENHDHRDNNRKVEPNQQQTAEPHETRNIH